MIMSSTQRVIVAFKAPADAKEVILTNTTRVKLESCSGLMTTMLTKESRHSKSVIKLTLTAGIPAAFSHVLTTIDRFGLSPKLFIRTRDLSLNEALGVFRAAKELKLKASFIAGIVSDILHRAKHPKMVITPVTIKTAHNMLSPFLEENDIAILYDAIVHKMCWGLVYDEYNAQQQALLAAAYKSFEALSYKVDKKCVELEVGKEAYLQRQGTKAIRERRQAQYDIKEARHRDWIYKQATYQIALDPAYLNEVDEMRRALEKKH